MCSSHLAAAYACLLNLVVAERLRGSYLFTLLYAVASFYFEGREPRDPAVTVISLLCPGGRHCPVLQAPLCVFRRWVRRALALLCSL